MFFNILKTLYVFFIYFSFFCHCSWPFCNIFTSILHFLFDIIIILTHNNRGEEDRKEYREIKLVNWRAKASARLTDRSSWGSSIALLLIIDYRADRVSRGLLLTVKKPKEKMARNSPFPHPAPTPTPQISGREKWNKSLITVKNSGKPKE